MVKRVFTSIIAVAVSMGVLVACGGTTQVVAPTPEEGHNEDDIAVLKRSIRKT